MYSEMFDGNAEDIVPAYQVPESADSVINYQDHLGRLEAVVNDQDNSSVAEAILNNHEDVKDNTGYNPEAIINYQDNSSSIGRAAVNNLKEYDNPTNHEYNHAGSTEVLSSLLAPSSADLRQDNEVVSRTEAAAALVSDVYMSSDDDNIGYEKSNTDDLQCDNLQQELEKASAPQTMVALFVEGDGSEPVLIERPVPEPKSKEALIKVRMAGLCCMDVEIFRGLNPFRGLIVSEHNVASFVV